MNGFDPDAFSRFERAGWEQKARGYHRFYAPLAGRVVERLLDVVDARKGKRVLDLGSGPGYVAAAARRRGCEAVGVDFSPAMVELARSMHPGSQFEVGDAQDLPFDGGSFDAVAGNFALHHVARQELALREARRVLRPGGRIGLTAWDRPDRNRFLGLFVDAVQEARASVPGDLPPGPPMVAGDEDHARLLREAGFSEPSVEHLTWTHWFPSPAQLWDGVMSASVRTAALIELQAPEGRSAIRRAFEAKARDYYAGDGIEVPVAVILVSGGIAVSEMGEMGEMGEVGEAGEAGAAGRPDDQDGPHGPDDAGVPADS